MGNFIVSARKYRPQRFREVVGQDHVVHTLENALKTDQLAHAFLFCGPRGVGKTTCARILARTINCENIQDHVNPCGTCSSCKSFDQNASFNIIELDAASHNSVEHIRALNEQVRFRPQHGEYKVYIIDEVHMLSMQAFNAFLKTLEEPPSYAIFILATTEKQKIIPTILSRCQIFDFKRIQVKDMVAHLEHICTQEGVTAEKDALITIARKSDGALRDALSLFDRLVSVSDKELTYQKVVSNLNLLDYDVFFRSADACFREDVHEVLLIFDEVQRNGFEGDAFLGGLAGHFRELLVCKDDRTLQLQDYSEGLKERYRNQAQIASASQILSALNIINEADVQYAQVRNKRLHVEMALARVCMVNRLISGTPFTPEKTDTQSSIPAEQTKTTAREKPVERKPATPPSIPKAPEVPRSDASVKQDPPAADAPTQRKPPEVPRIPTTKAKATQAPPDTAQGPAIINTPQLGSLSHLRSQIEASEREARENSLDLTEENLTKWWTDFRDTIESPSVRTTFNQAQLRLDDGRVVIEVGSQLAKTRILEELDLMPRLRECFHMPTLEVDFNVNLSEELVEAQKPKKLLTNKEKYELLCQKNPLMRDLKERLDLFVDHDDQ
ncbi:MAG: DNA polymerase III subunit gamma/tau [Saprospiraceae bacterium]|nr:DNA polymerase III subunit gamma/tau [Saprospiraceae bacterium]